MNYEVLKGCMQRLERASCAVPNKCAFLDQVHELVFRYEYAFIEIYEVGLIRRYVMDASSRKHASKECLNLVCVAPEGSALQRRLGASCYELKGKLLIGSINSGVTRW